MISGFVSARFGALASLVRLQLRARLQLQLRMAGLPRSQAPRRRASARLTATAVTTPPRRRRCSVRLRDRNFERKARLLAGMSSRRLWSLRFAGPCVRPVSRGSLMARFNSAGTER